MEDPMYDTVAEEEYAAARTAAPSSSTTTAPSSSTTTAARRTGPTVHKVGMELSQAHKEMVTPPQQQHPLFLDFSHGDGDGGNGRNKRPREAVAAPPPRLSSLQTPQGSPMHKVISLAPRLHKRPAAAATGLQLDLNEGGSEYVPCTSSLASSLLPDGEFAAQCDRYKNEMDQLLQEHAERLRRGLADASRRHGRSLLSAAGQGEGGGGLEGGAARL